MLHKCKFENSILHWVDFLSYLISYPCFSAGNFCIASYISTTDDNLLVRYINYVIVGPVCFIFTLLFLPLGIIGIFMWLLTCILATSKVNYRYWEFLPHKIEETKNTFSIATMNVCLLPECLSKFNNNKCTLRRCFNIGNKLTNRIHANLKEEHIITEFPELDFICFQEVWERMIAWLLIFILKKEYHYFVYDVEKHQWNVNYFCLGSGLMFASKYPVLEVSFNPFTSKTSQGRFTSIGLLQVKVQLEKSPLQKVGYIATTHLQSYQGRYPCLLNELDECELWLQKFRDSTKLEDEIIAFDIVCGDFNFDNMSPSDKYCSAHSIFNTYVDPCKTEDKIDHEWAIGTEFRQKMLWNETINSAEKLKQILLNPITRRCFILDADVLEQTIELAYKMPPYGENGEIEYSITGGRRRIDYILYHTDFSLNILHFYYVTAFTQLTDHIPLCMVFYIN